MTDRRKVVLNAGNLRHGGGVQVGASVAQHFLENRELLERRLNADVEIWASPQVAASLPAGTNLRVQEASPLHQLVRRITYLTRRFDAELVVFGPVYGPRIANRQVMGCADVTTFYATPWRERRPFSDLKWWLRRRLAKRAFASAEQLVVESRSMAEAIASGLNASVPTVVIANSTHQIFDQPSQWDYSAANKLRAVSAACNIPYITRHYPHKRIDFVGQIVTELRKTKPEVRLVLTLRDDEWLSLSPATREVAINLGPLNIQAVPPVWEMADLFIFPSLLEAFSVSTLEAMRMNVPIVSVDADYVREVCEEAPCYFSVGARPDEVAVLADQVLSDDDLALGMVNRGARVYQGRASAADRGEQLVELLSAVLADPVHDR